MQDPDSWAEMLTNKSIFAAADHYGRARVAATSRGIYHYASNTSHGCHQSGRVERSVAWPDHVVLGSLRVRIESSKRPVSTIGLGTRTKLASSEGPQTELLRVKLYSLYQHRANAGPNSQRIEMPWEVRHA